ncbi:MAG: thymidine phosphorylase [Planctomycetota bacterium]
MLATRVIEKKRDSQTLRADEIQDFIAGFCAGEIADYQMSAFAMAICINGMDVEETASLTAAMLDSGDRLPAGDRIRVDKHSTGGLGDKVSLILAPLLAAAGFDVPMISGRGLGITGGTLDKLQSISGFRVEIERERAREILNQTGCFIIGADANIAPADRKLYALRDVTGTVPSVPLITSSILSKKLAAGLDALVMDIKCGSAAFMKTIDDARLLGQTLCEVGTRSGLAISALITDMDQPLGSAIGNAIEVNEAVKILRCESLTPSQQRVADLTLELASTLAGQASPREPQNESSQNPWRERLLGLLESGNAYERWEKMVHLQGGSLINELPLAPEFVIHAKRDGWVHSIDSLLLGLSVLAWGGGRSRAGDAIDHSVGMQIEVLRGDRVRVGQPILRCYTHQPLASEYVDAIRGGFQILDQPCSSSPLILERLDACVR